MATRAFNALTSDGRPIEGVVSTAGGVSRIELTMYGIGDAAAAYAAAQAAAAPQAIITTHGATSRDGALTYSFLATAVTEGEEGTEGIETEIIAELEDGRRKIVAMRSLYNGKPAEIVFHAMDAERGFGVYIGLEMFRTAGKHSAVEFARAILAASGEEA